MAYFFNKYNTSNMKRLLFLFALLLSAQLSAQEATHNNRLYFTIGETKDLTKVPLMLYLDNSTIDITAVEAYIAMPENTLLGDGVLCGRAKNHELMEGNVEGVDFVSIASPSLSVMKNGNEVICTWLCDFSQLPIGEHTITATRMFAVGVNATGIISYTVAEQSLTIEIEENTTSVEKVGISNETEKIYDLNGRCVKEITEKGIYIVNGRKVVFEIIE